MGAWPLLSREDSLGLLETRSYDDAGRVSLIDNGAGESISFEFYPEGGVFAASICRSHDSSCAWGSPEYGYDKLWRKETISATGHPIRGAIWQYDEVGNLLKGGGTATPTSAGRPGIASRGFNADRELTSIDYWSQETYDTETLEIERRSDGQPTRITRPYGADTEFDYDTLGRIVSRRERVDGTWQGLPLGVRRPRSRDGRRKAQRHANGNPLRRRGAHHGNQASTRWRSWKRLCG